MKYNLISIEDRKIFVIAALYHLLEEEHSYPKKLYRNKYKYTNTVTKNKNIYSYIFLSLLSIIFCVLINIKKLVTIWKYSKFY